MRSTLESKDQLDRPEDRLSHGSPERVPGALARKMAEAALEKGIWPSQESLAGALCRELLSFGVRYHVRTVKRQISGQIATVPPEVLTALAKVLFNGNGRACGDEILRLCGSRQPDAAVAPDYVLSQKVLPLVRLWLHLNPHVSKRALAIRLQRNLRARRVSYTLGALEAILAGKNRLLIKAIIQEKLLTYLREFGIHSRVEAEERIRTGAEVIRRSLAERQLVPSRRFHELSSLWLWAHRQASARDLAGALQQKLLQRGVRMNLDYVQHAVAGRSRQVRRLLEAALGELLQEVFPPPDDLDRALARTWRDRLRHKEDMDWVKTEPLIALANNWLEQHPGMSLRQLAVRLAARIQHMGYSRSQHTLQPILGGWKKRTRRFVYRAMLIEYDRSMKCLTRSCVFPAVQDGLCRVCLLRKYDTMHFRGVSALGGELCRV